MEERRDGVYDGGGHVAVHGVEREICDENGWYLGFLGRQAAVPRSVCHGCYAALTRDLRRTTQGMLSLRERNRPRWMSTTRPPQRFYQLSSQERKIIHRCFSGGQRDSYINVISSTGNVRSSGDTTHANGWTITGSISAYR